MVQVLGNTIPLYNGSGGTARLRTLEETLTYRCLFLSKNAKTGCHQQLSSLHSVWQCWGELQTALLEKDVAVMFCF